MRCEQRSKLWLPSLVAGGLAVALLFWASYSERRQASFPSIVGEELESCPPPPARQLAAGEPPAKWLPDVESVPANALKFYLLFFDPMTEGDIFTHLKLERRTGTGWQLVEGAFREVELWSPDNKRLTVWLHPGRQKAGVNLNEDEGPVLIEGGEYQLVLNGSATSQTGRPLGKDAILRFRATAADHSCPNPKEWSWDVSRSVSPEGGMAFVLNFPKPLDWAMLSSAFQADGKPLKVKVEDNARSVRFGAPEAWAGRRHVIEVVPTLEDMAGNNLLSPFEADASAARKAPSSSLIRVSLKPFD